MEAIKSTNSDAKIYSFGVDQSFSSYGIKNSVENFYYGKIESFDLNAIVVFNEQKFKTPWRDSHVMRNWIDLKNNYSLEEVAKVRKGWNIYVIKEILSE